MQQVFLSVITWLLPYINTIAGRVLVALGFGYAEYQGLDLLITSAKASIESSWASFASGSTAQMLAWAGFFRLDVHLSILLSAIGVKVLLNSLTGSIKRIVPK